MNRRVLILAAALMLAALALVLAGCGGKTAQAAACAGCGMQVAADTAPAADGKIYCSHCAPKPEAAPAAAPSEAPADSAAATAEGQAAVHDCAGGCGMTNVPEAQLTEIDGKWYCAGCAHKAAGDHAGHDHG